MTQAQLRYRPEIDGLRMIAVLAVVFYHFGMPGLRGGFAGVDVFFVISGYLIGGLLWREVQETGRINLASFYKRRVKRLAPAYFAMAFAATIVGWFVLLPFEFREFGKSLIAATVYLSNVLFYRGEGYFDIGADSKVLLHTWSLSVEEQFYIVLPLFLVLLSRWRRLFVAFLAVGFMASLIGSVWLTPTAQTATFYLFPFRAWELLAGVLLAIATVQGKLPRLGAWASWLGLLLVSAGLVFIDATKGFPGWQVIAPVFGTVLLLANGQQCNPVNAGLSKSVPVFFGKISYSLYLWHWPVYVLSSNWRDGYSGSPEAVFWMLVSLALAILSWRFIETPFRRQEAVSGRAVLAVLTVPTALALGAGALIYMQNGLPNRFGAETRAHIDASGDFLQDWSRCERPLTGAFEGMELCPIGPQGDPEVLIWGDSHVRAIKEGLEEAAFAMQTPALIIWHAGCPPLFDVSKTESYATPAQDTACSTEKAQMRTALASLPSLKRVLLVGRWAYYTEGAGIGLDAGNTIVISGLGGSNAAEVLKRGFETTMNEFRKHGLKGLVLQQLPEVPKYDSREAARLLAHKSVDAAEIAKRATVPLAQVKERQGAAMAILENWPTLETWSAVCADGNCNALHEGKSWYFDNNHIVNHAARAISERFEPLFRGEANQ